MNEFVAIAMGGAIGACARFAMGQWMANLCGQSFPYGTLLVNMMGCFFIGLIYSLLHGAIQHQPWWIFLVVGVLGAFTTFSTFSMDTLLMFQQGNWLKAGANIVLNMVLCLTLTWFGFKLGAMK